MSSPNHSDWSRCPLDDQSLSLLLSHPLISNMTKQATQRRSYCFVWNNYPDDYNSVLSKRFLEIGAERWVWQQEKGEQGTPHIQGVVEFKKKIRYTQIGITGIHYDSMKGSFNQAAAYASKEDTRDGIVHCYGYRLRREPECITVDQFYEWQQEMYMILQASPDKRLIYWVWEAAGNTGKSEFVKHMMLKQEATLCNTSKGSDMINLVYKRQEEGLGVDIILWDLPRSAMGKINFEAVEQIKNGIISNSKYETGQAVIPVPHIVIFSNQVPANMAGLSYDRWCIKEIVGLGFRQNVQEQVEIGGGNGETPPNHTCFYGGFRGFIT